MISSCDVRALHRGPEGIWGHARQSEQAAQGYQRPPGCSSTAPARTAVHAGRRAVPATAGGAIIEPRATNASSASASDVPKTNELQQLPEQTAAAAAAARLFGGYGGEPVECTAATEDGASAPAPVPAAAILMAPHAPSGSKKAGRPRFSRKQLAAVVAVVVAIAAVVAIVLLATDSDMDASCTATAGELGPAVPWAAATDGSELSITLTGDVACAVGSPCNLLPAARRRSRSRTPGGTCESNAGGIVPAARRRRRPSSAPWRTACGPGPPRPSHSSACSSKT